MFDIESIGAGRIRLVGRLDASQAEKATNALREIDGPLTADCSALEYISSAGIGVLLETYKRLHGAGHTLTLAHLTPRIRNVFAYAGLDRVLRIE
ncbi:MAG TPA: STAS domain-containing protein [Candidatus Eisenbacteria bacterium]